MKRAAARGVLVLVLLLALAFFLHRAPGGEGPARPPSMRIAAIEPPEVEQLPPPATRVRPSPSIPVGIRPAAAEPLRNGIVRGTVKISGVPPTRRKARLDADPNCEKLHPNGLLRDDIVVDPGNNVRWAFVYVAGANPALSKGPLPPVLLDQVGCRFEPHVLGILVHQPLNIFNNDRFLHNVHITPVENKEFNFGLPAAGLFETKIFTRPEVMIKIVCHIHPWMRAWVGVLDHPHFCVTGEAGSFEIPDLPPGRHRIKAWHELYETVESELEVPSGGDVRFDFFLHTRKKESP